MLLFKNSGDSLDTILVKKTHGPKKQECSKQYDETTTRQSDGHFVVKMPFKKPTPAFGESFKQARQRLKHKKGDCRETVS